ncbi:MAG: O-antigen ligase family protein, partial [Maioricimonas sp. JB049]
MALRPLLFLIAYTGAILFAFAFPQVGVWGFVFESNEHPPYKWWGRSMPSIGDRWSLYIGAVMIAATLLHWNRFKHAQVFSHLQTKLLFLFTLNTILVSFWAYDFDVSWKEAVDNIKWFAVYICIVRTHSSPKWRSVVLMIYILACVDAGVETTLNPRGGRSVARGEGPVTTQGENFLSPHAIALMPLAGAYALTPQTPLVLRGLLVVGLPCMLNIVAHGQSRGAFLALLAAALAMLLFSRGRMRMLTILVLIIGAMLSARLFHEQFWNRMNTIETYEEDGSATGRIDAWKDAWGLSLNFPIGYGGECFDRGVRRQSKSTHNMYFECLVAWGFQGTFLWLGYIGVACWNCWQITRKHYHPRTWRRSRDYLESFALLVGLISMLVAAVFLNRMRWELWWVFPAYVLCIKNCLHQQQIRQRQAQRDALQQQFLTSSSGQQVFYV